MSLTCPIPKKIRDQIDNDPFYNRCCVTGQLACRVKLEVHHAMQFAGRRVNELWALLPLAPEIHAQEKNKEMKERLNWIMVNRARRLELEPYSKVIDWWWKRHQLNEKFGEWTPKWYEQK